MYEWLIVSSFLILEKNSKQYVYARMHNPLNIWKQENFRWYLDDTMEQGVKFAYLGRPLLSRVWEILTKGRQQMFLPGYIII